MDRHPGSYDQTNPSTKKTLSLTAAQSKKECRTTSSRLPTYSIVATKMTRSLQLLKMETVSFLRLLNHGAYCHVCDHASQEKNRRHLASQSPTRACWKRTRKMSVSSSIKHRVNFRLHICLSSTNRLADSWPCRILLLMAIIS